MNIKDPIQEDIPKIIPLKDLGNALLDWLVEEDNYWIKKFLVQQDLTEEEFSEMCESDNNLDNCYKKAMMVQEFKIITMAKNGSIKDQLAMQLGKTYHSWAQDQNVNISNTFGRAVDETVDRAKQVVQETIKKE